MNPIEETVRPNQATHELRFISLFREGHALSFPCDEGGHVQLDEMSERARTNYFFARTSVGRDFFAPKVQMQVSLSHP